MDNRQQFNQYMISSTDWGHRGTKQAGKETCISQVFPMKHWQISNIAGLKYYDHHQVCREFIMTIQQIPFLWLSSNDKLFTYYKLHQLPYSLKLSGNSKCDLHKAYTSKAFVSPFISVIHITFAIFTPDILHTYVNDYIIQSIIPRFSEACFCSTASVESLMWSV